MIATQVELRVGRDSRGLTIGMLEAPGGQALGTPPRAALALGIPALALAGVVLVGVHPRRDPRTPEPLKGGSAT